MARRAQRRQRRHRRPPSDADAARDAGVDGNAGSNDAGADLTIDVDIDPDTTADLSLDRDDASDVASDPSQDPTAEDAVAEPRLDVPTERTIDVVDARPDTTGDADAGPPFSCSGTCNNFANIAPTIARTVDPGPAPMMTGGNIVDGTYVTSSIVHYNGDSTPYTLAETSIISGNYDTWVSSINGNAEMRVTTTLVAMNNQISLPCAVRGRPISDLLHDQRHTLSHIDPTNINRVITYTRQ